MHRDRVKIAQEELFYRLRFSIIEDDFKCGYCKTHVIKLQYQLFDNEEALKWSRCSNPTCNQINIFLENKLIHPFLLNIDVSNKVPKEYSDRYKKAHQILNICPEASATLSRKCLEMILEDRLGAKKRNIGEKISEVKEKLSSDLYNSLHKLRLIGRFGAHPKKDSHTAELIEVEPGEAEYCLWLLEELFDFCFIKPAKKRDIEEQINKKINSSENKIGKF